MKTYFSAIVKRCVNANTRLFSLAAFTLWVVLHASSPVAFASAGDLDTIFGTNGLVLTSFDNNAEGNAVAVQSDGKIVMAGEAGNDFAVARYNSDGSLDNNFGSGGRVTTDFNDNNDEAYSVAVQPDGKIIVAGSSGGDFAVARYNSNGSLDSTFGNNGLVTTDYSRSGPGDIAYAVAIQSDGKIVVAGSSYDATEYEEFALLRYYGNGFLDSTFGVDGIVIIPVSGQSQTMDIAYAVAVQSNGNILVAGQSREDFALLRHTSNGSLDSNFGNGGIVITDFNSDAAAHALAVQTDGKIVVAGESEVYDESTQNCTASGGRYCQYYDFAVARYNSNGSLDSQFGDAGRVTTNLNPRGNDDHGYAVAIQSNGKIIVAGYSETSVHTFNGEDEFFSSDNQFSLARYNSNGSLDTSFSTDGVVITDIDPGSNETGRGVAIQSDGKIVVGGTDRERGDFALIRYEVDEAVTPPVTPPTADGGYHVGSELWIKGILQVPNSPKTMVWKEVGTDITKSGDKVISGYFYVDPNDFEFGSISNPELFVKIYIRSDGWCNMAFNHVTVDDVMISSAFGYQGAPEQTGSVTLNSRLDEHQYTGVSPQ